jgi:hypothetical protein
MKFQAYVPFENASSGGCVEKLLMNRRFPVDRARMKIFFRGATVGTRGAIGLWTSFRQALRLIARHARVKFVAFQQTTTYQPEVPIEVATTAVHHFRELIAGQPYLIEVSAVATNRWRAYIVRLPGMPTALMPFYGPTPGQAADQLRLWLTHAHERAANASRKV